jgi:hypothetical protein
MTNLTIKKTSEFYYSKLEIANASRRVGRNINKRATSLINNNIKQQNHEYN